MFNGFILTINYGGIYVGPTMIYGYNTTVVYTTVVL